ncbi:mucin-2 isoform X2 [Eurytemora carolleeae]|uniref:mucin-2 isoform X2 n=1 Tax=Eurytemora carolleeae TaxID=1294199 RepID=UPI000C77B95D|nr:mucin-2 isoform X2 [Eurytemora carolleeae]|eukprot:XP_023321234.1 mucin-2-like isoform X2 [Eurytemora affinis]
MLKMFKMLVIFLICSRSKVFSGDCEELRTENRLLRELLAVQNNRYDSTQTPKVESSIDISPSPALTPVWSLSSYTSTFQTTVTVPVNTEIPLYFNGKAITSTIVEYETKETVGTTVLPTRILVYPNNSDVSAGVTNEKKEPETSSVTQEQQQESIAPSKSQPINTEIISSSAVLRRPPGFRPSRKITTAPKSFTLTRATFTGFGSTGFRFKRDHPDIRDDLESEVTLQSGMEE